MKSKAHPRVTERVAEKKPPVLAFFLLFILFAGMTIGLAYLFLYSLAQLDFVSIEKIDIRGTVFIDEGDIYKYIEEFLGKNIFTVPDSKIEPIFPMFPRIKRARIERRLPNTLVISIDERLPVAVVPTYDGQSLYIDREGVVIDTESPSPIHLPIFRLPNDIAYSVGDKIQSEALMLFFTVYDEIKSQKPEFLNKIYEFSIRDGEIVLTDNDYGTQLIVGSDDFKKSVNKLIFVNENFGFAHFSEIDLRFSDPQNELIILR